MTRSIQAIDRDLQMTVERRKRSKLQISQLEQACINDDRHIDRLLLERHAAAVEPAGHPGHPARVGATP